MEYSNYSAADFAADHSFIQWVTNSTPDQNIFWTNWIKEHPGKYETIQEARKLVVLLSQDEDEIMEWEKDAIWQKLLVARSMHDEEQATATRVIPFRTWSDNLKLAAAAIGLLLFVAGLALYNFNYHPTLEYATDFGEKRTIYLPDSSMVVLNANSKITLPSDWAPDKPREVNLSGEAYFSVTHKLNNQKFIVHTMDDMQVEVLGTEFSVTGRTDKSRVVLASGKVRLNIGRGKSQEQLIMKPGEMVEVIGKTDEIIKKEVRTEIYTSWKDNKLIFDNTSLREIAIILKEDYGYTVIFEDKSIIDQRMTAFLNESSLSNILVAISETFDVEIHQEKKKIIIKSLNN